MTDSSRIATMIISSPPQFGQLLIGKAITDSPRALDSDDPDAAAAE